LPENADGRQGVYSHDLFTKEALSFIERSRERPFFLYLAYTIPHAELLVPEDSLSQFRGRWPETPYKGTHYGDQPTPRAAWAAMITRMDRDIGSLLGRLKELGIDENTLVIFSSDNGPTGAGGADRKFFRNSGPFRGAKSSLFEGGIRVPMIARWRGRIQAGTTSGHVSTFWDFLPTAAQIAGARAPDNTDGISYLPELLGRTQPRHEHLYWEYPLTKRDKIYMQAVRMGDWKAVRRHPSRPFMLFNLKQDIGEREDVSKLHPDIVRRIEAYVRTARTKSDVWKIAGIET
jgi:arylsulfatase A-like enzyme